MARNFVGATTTDYLTSGGATNIDFNTNVGWWAILRVDAQTGTPGVFACAGTGARGTAAGIAGALGLYMGKEGVTGLTGTATTQVILDEYLAVQCWATNSGNVKFKRYRYADSTLAEETVTNSNLLIVPVDGDLIRIGNYHSLSTGLAFDGDIDRVVLFQGDPTGAEFTAWATAGTIPGSITVIGSWILSPLGPGTPASPEVDSVGGNNLTVTGTTAVAPFEFPAGPAFVGAGAEGSAASGNITLGAPASPQTNDVWIAAVHSSDQVAHTFSGWTQIFQANGGGTTSRLSAWYFRYAGSTPNLVVTHAAGQSPVGGIAAFRGCKTSGSPVNVLGTGGAGTDASIELSAVTTTVDDCLLLAINGSADDNARALPTGFTAALSEPPLTNAYLNTLGTPDGSVSIHYKTQAAAGSSGALVDTQGTLAVPIADPWASVLLALEPEGAAASVPLMVLESPLFRRIHGRVFGRVN